MGENWRSTRIACLINMMRSIVALCVFFLLLVQMLAAKDDEHTFSPCLLRSFSAWQPSIKEIPGLLLLTPRHCRWPESKHEVTPLPLNSNENKQNKQTSKTIEAIFFLLFLSCQVFNLVFVSWMWATGTSHRTALLSALFEFTLPQVDFNER